MNRLTRLLRYLPLAVVAGITAYASYLHGFHVALRYGELPEIARLLPVSVDGMMIVASIAMIDDRRAGRRIRPWAKYGFLIGVIASSGANLAAAQPTIGSFLVHGWPALALLLVVEIQSRAGKPIPQPLIPEVVLAAPAQAPSVAANALKPLNGSRVARTTGELSDEALRVKVAGILRTSETRVSVESLAHLCGVGKKRVSEALAALGATA